MIAALMRRLMSFDTSVMRASGNSSLSASVWPRMALSAPCPGKVTGKPPLSALVWKNSRPLEGFFLPPPFVNFAAGSSRPRSICALVALAINSSRKRLTWRTLRAASDKPFLPASSSSSTIIGMKMSCSSKRKIAVGSCINTLVSSTKIRRWCRSREVVRPRLVSGSSPLGMTLERLRCFEHCVRVAGDFHLAPLLPQHAAAVDQERAALDSHVLATVHALLLPDVEQLAHLL